MVTDQTKDSLNLTKKFLEEGGDEHDFAIALQKIGPLVSQSSQDELFRLTLAEDIGFLDLCVDTITNSLSVKFQSPEEAILHVRLLRAVLILLRNLLASSKSVVDLPLLLLNIQHFTSTIDLSNPFYSKCFSAYLEVLANMAMSQGENFKSNIQLVAHTFNSLLEPISEDKCLSQPFLVFLIGCFNEESNVSNLLKDEANAPLLEYVLSLGFELLKQDNLEVSDDQILCVFEKLIINESFKPWLEQNEQRTDFISVLKVAQLVATLEKEWTNIQCTVIMEWSYAYLQKWSAAAIELLNESGKEAELKEVHLKLVIVLDIISDLAKYHLAKQFLQHYNGLEVLINLLRAAHEMGESSTKLGGKKSDTIVNATSKKPFPMVKSLVVEILAYVVHNSFESQEKFRELHGLELLLSNCIIDDSNPYIKERSILCLRFVLEKNQKNQDFVALLEAKQVVDDEALRDVGYEVEVEDGQVKLKKS